MLENAKNKAMAPERTKAEPLEEYHFPGEGQYKPLTIKASSRQEAEREWEKKRETN